MSPKSQFTNLQWLLETRVTFSVADKQLLRNLGIAPKLPFLKGFNRYLPWFPSLPHQVNVSHLGGDDSVHDFQHVAVAQHRLPHRDVFQTISGDFGESPWRKSWNPYELECRCFIRKIENIFCCFIVVSRPETLWCCTLKSFSNLATNVSTICRHGAHAAKQCAVKLWKTVASQNKTFRKFGEKT